MNDTNQTQVEIVGRAEVPTVQQDAVTALAAPEAYAQDMFNTLGGFELAQRMAGALSRSTLLPAQFQGNVANCLVLLDLASRFKSMGISPFTVAQQLVVVHGRPGWMGQFVIALINRSGMFAGPLQFDFKGEGDEYGCTARAIRHDGEVIEGVKVTLRMVKGEGWFTKKDKYGNETSKWQTMPQQMFQYRAAAFFGRIHCPELLMGYQTADELEDIGPMRDVGRGNATSTLLNALNDNDKKAA